MATSAFPPDRAAGFSAGAAAFAASGGSALALLLLYALAASADLLGLGLPGLAAALDPARSGSLPELWGVGWLAAAATVAAAAAGARDGTGATVLLRLAVLPATLALVEASDLAARLEPGAAALLGAPSGLPAAKLLADALASGLILAAAAVAAGVGRAASPLGRRLLAAVLVAGSASVACDATASACAFLAPAAAALAHGAETIEEVIELGLYALVAASVLGAAAERGG